MTSNLNLYAGRKFLGPLDVAQINAVKSREKIIKTAVLQELVNDLEEIEKQLKEEKLSKSDEIMLKLLRSQLNNQLYDFLGVPYHGNGTSEDS